jgi:hypothetical protein
MRCHIFSILFKDHGFLGFQPKVSHVDWWTGGLVDNSNPKLVLLGVEPGLLDATASRTPLRELEQ